jgi:hypothetical protein
MKDDRQRIRSFDGRDETKAAALWREALLGLRTKSNVDLTSVEVRRRPS